MTHNSQSLRDDIAYMKTLADEGAATPLVGGPILMLFGVIFAVLNLVAWIGNRMGYPPQEMYWLNWVGFIAGVVGLPLLVRRVKRQPGARSPANQAFGMVWAAVGFAIFVLMIIVYVACGMAKSGLPAMMMGPAIICLYAVGWSVAAAMARQNQKFLLGVAGLCYATAIVPVLAWNHEHGALIMAVLVVLIAFVPGYVLFRQEPKSIV